MEPDLRSYPGYLTAEAKDIIVSVAVLTAAFFILLLLHLPGAFGDSAPVILGVSFLTVLTAFLLHELAHRFVAKRYGGIAFFKMWVPGLLLVFITSFFGFLLAAPGAVNIGGVFRKDQIGKTAFAGPLTNLIIGSVLYGAGQLVIGMHASPLLYQVLHWSSALNLWFALFNLIPIAPFDGEKIFRWDLHVYITFGVVTIIMNILNGLFI